MENKTVSDKSDLFISAIDANYILKDSSEIHVYINMELEYSEARNLESLDVLKQVFKANWVLQAASGIKEKYTSGKIDFPEAVIHFEERKVRLFIKVPRIREHADAMLVLEFIDLGASRKFIHETYIDFNTKRPNHLLGLYFPESDQPNFASFIQAGKEFTLRHLDGNKMNVVLKRFDTKPPAALSPMSSSKRNELAGFREVERIVVKTDEQVTLQNEGAYVMYTDTSSSENGYGFLVVDHRFPRLTEREELLDPLVYMSTNEEINELQAGPESKQALDLYFLELASGNEELGKQIIRSYYRRIEKANKLFSNFKEGWKTDKGMIYTIMGPPTKIQRNGNREIWMYAQNNNFSEIIFTFYRKPNQFSESHYELVRYPEYAAYWYPYVEAWRKGSILE